MFNLKEISDVIAYFRPLAFLGIFTVVIAAAFAAYSSVDYLSGGVFPVLEGAISLGLLASASHSFNNLFDRKADSVNKPQRCQRFIKSKIKHLALITASLYVSSFFLALGAAFNSSHIFFSIYILLLLISLAYSHPLIRLKRHWLSASLSLAISRALLVTLAGWSLLGSLRHPAPWFIGAVPTFFLLGASNTKDISDLKGDSMEGIRTLPLEYGLSNTKKLIMPFMVLPFLFIPIGVYFRLLLPASLPIILLSFYGYYACSLIETRAQETTIIEGNHVSWKHSYIIYMAYFISIALSFMV